MSATGLSVQSACTDGRHASGWHGKFLSSATRYCYAVYRKIGIKIGLFDSDTGANRHFSMTGQKTPASVNAQLDELMYLPRPPHRCIRCAEVDINSISHEHKRFNDPPHESRSLDPVIS